MIIWQNIQYNACHWDLHHNISTASLLGKFLGPVCILNLLPTLIQHLKGDFKRLINIILPVGITSKTLFCHNSDQAWSDFLSLHHVLFFMKPVLTVLSHVSVRSGIMPVKLSYIIQSKIIWGPTEQIAAWWVKLVH